MRSVTGRGAFLLAAALLSPIACRPQPSALEKPTAPRPKRGDYTGRLVDPSGFPYDFSWRQEISASYGAQHFQFSAVLQKSEDTVAIVGLTPFGSRAFLLTQRGQNVRFEKFVDRDLKLEPRSVLIDVHRTFFRWLPGAPHPDGTHQGRDGGEDVTEVWSGGKLVERVFRDPHDAADAPPIRIVFHGGALPGKVTRLVTLTNGWYGYELVLKTVEAHAL